MWYLVARSGDADAWWRRGEAMSVKAMVRITAMWLGLGATSAAVCVAAEQYAVVFERNVAVKMRDGVTLRADIYRPQADGKFPVLLQRTPYDRRNFDFGLKGAARGYVVIFQ